MRILRGNFYYNLYVLLYLLITQQTLSLFFDKIFELQLPYSFMKSGSKYSIKTVILFKRMKRKVSRIENFQKYFIKIGKNSCLKTINIFDQKLFDTF